MNKWNAAFKKYGAENCRSAYLMNRKLGYGPRGIVLEGPHTIKTTRQADAAINAWAAFDAHMQTFRE